MPERVRFSPAESATASAMPKSSRTARPSDDDDVLRLHVPVDDAVPVGVVQGVEQVGAKPDDIVDREGTGTGRCPRAGSGRYVAP